MIPNLLSFSRIFLPPVALGLFHNGYNWLSLGLSICIFLTDFWDGYFARKWNQITEFGSILDPVADKISIFLYYLYFFLFQSSKPISSENFLGFSFQYFWFGYFFLSTLRDFLQLSAIPILLFWKKISFQVKPKLFPKIGTALKFCIIFFFLLSPIADRIFQQTAVQNSETFLSWIQLVLLVISTYFEVIILFTFVPRFFQIYFRKHDTFE